MCKVKYIGASDDQVRWGNNDDPRGLLTKGEFYTVEREEVHSYHTKYHLKEFPGKKFNSVCFTPDRVFMDQKRGGKANGGGVTGANP